MKDSKYYKKMCQKNKNTKSENNIWISKLLIAIIIVLVSLIITNFNNDIREKYISNVLERNISFSSINKFYEKYIGSFIKSDISDDMMVANANTLDSIEKLDDGSYSVKVYKDEPLMFLGSGIIVFVGEKDNLGNTVIVQGNDGVDVWYSNVILNDYSLYDYVKKGAILGNIEDEKMIITIMKDGQKLEYEEYFK